MLIANKIFHVTVVFTLAINLWHQKFVTADASLQSLRRGQDFDKKSLHLKGYTAKRLTDEFPRKAGQSMMLISCWKSCGTQAQLTGGQAEADHAEPALKKTLSFFLRSSRSLPLTLFCRLSSEVTEKSFLSVKKTKSVAYCRNFWSRSLARFMLAAQFVSVSSCARRLLKHFRCKSLQIIWDTDDRWIPVSSDISRTVLWVCGLSSWLRTMSLTVSTFSSLRAQIDDESK